jgi:hypothetical protein
MCQPPRPKPPPKGPPPWAKAFAPTPATMLPIRVAIAMRRQGRRGLSEWDRFVSFVCSVMSGSFPALCACNRAGDGRSLAASGNTGFSAG